MAVSRGYIKVPRDLFQSWIWKSAKPFCEGAAFIDLIYRARYMPTEVVKQGRIIRLSRGETHDSQYELAEAWGWGRTQVRGFLAKLLKTNRITQRTTHGVTITKVVNYDTYELQEITPDQPDNPPPNPTDAQRQPAPLYKEKEGEIKGESLPLNPPQGEGATAPRERARRGFVPPSWDEWRAEAEALGWKDSREIERGFKYHLAHKWKGVGDWCAACWLSMDWADKQTGRIKKNGTKSEVVIDYSKVPRCWPQAYEELFGEDVYEDVYDEERGITLPFLKFQWNVLLDEYPEKAKAIVLWLKKNNNLTY